jgi:tetratricopeptide (TPR) repeat protein
VAGNRRTYDAAIRRAAGLVREHRWSTAIEAYNEALAEYPQDVAALTGLGLAYAQTGQSDKALSAYRQAADLSSDNPEVIVRVAHTLERLARWPEAANAYVRAAQACVQLHDTPQAIDLWRKAAMLDPQCLAAHQGLAQAYVGQGDTRKAARHHLIIARVQNRQRHLSKALEHCKAALELDPHNPEAHAILGALTSTATHSDARTLPDGPTARLQPDAEGKRTLDSFVVFEDIELQSMSMLSDASRSSPADIVRERTVAQMAEALFSDEAQPQPAQGNVLLAQGADLQARGLVDRAIETYSAALSAVARTGTQASIPQAPAVHLNLGLLYCEKAQFERAVEHLDQALSESDLELGARFALGECYLAWERTTESLRHLLETLRLIDSHMVLESQVEELNAAYAAAYARIIEGSVRQGDTGTAAALAQSIIAFLSSKGWRERILQVRQQLNRLASDGILITLAEMVIEGKAETVATAICQIQEYLAQNMFFTALEECFWAIQQAPHFLPLHLLMADVLIAKGQLAGAVSKYIVTAETYQARGDVQRAIAIYGRALQIAPMNIEVREKLVGILVQAGMIDRAMEQYIAAADSYYQLAQIDRAIETLSEALTHASQGDPARHWPSNILHRIGDINTQRLDWQQAIRVYSRIKRIDPQDAKARFCLVDLYFKSGQRDAALRELDQLIDVYQARRQPRELLNLLQDAVRARPDELGLRMRLAKLYLDLRRTAEAISELDSVGELQLKLEMPQEAIRTIQAIIRLGPENVEGYRQLLAQLQGR